ncbi:MAG: PTS sugar transporter subunit IIA [Limnochordales bacterium]|nr:PTS sugar transporter subunit IIA [Limnochordales bacterium]
MRLELLDLGLEANSAEQVILALADRLAAQGLVRAEFGPAVWQREQASPTGLPARGAGVAIPHGDPDLVLAPAIGFAKLARPVAFREMGNPGATVSVELVFMLALQEAASHLRVLQQLVELIRDEGTLLRLKAAREPAEAAALLAPVAGGG